MNTATIDLEEYCTMRDNLKLKDKEISSLKALVDLQKESKTKYALLCASLAQRNNMDDPSDIIRKFETHFKLEVKYATDIEGQKLILTFPQE